MQPSKEQEEFLKAYEQSADAIFRHCYFRVFQSELAQDLMQETFIRTWEYIAKGKEVKNIRAFLYTVANNLIIDESRKKKTLSLDALQEKGFDPRLDTREQLLNQIDAKHIVQIVSKLDPTYQEVIMMRYIDELSPKEIAEILHESENTISVRIHRGLQKLRKILNHD